MLDLLQLLDNVHVQDRIRTPVQSQRARIKQRESADQRADSYARELEKRQSLERALSSVGIDAERFRWLGTHSARAGELAGQNLDEMRRTIDSWIKQEAIRRLAEMRRKHKELTGKTLPEMEWERA